MQDEKINVGIIMGGKSVECEISLISGLQVYFALDKQKYHPTIFYLDKNNHLYVGKNLNQIETYQNLDIKLLNEVHFEYHNHQVFYYLIKRPKKKHLIDIFLPVVHGYGTEDGTICGFLDMYNAIYPVSDVIPSAIIQDKEATKALLIQHNLPTLPLFTITEKEYQNDIEQILEKILNFESLPLIIKPAYLGSSIGIEVVNNKEELKMALNNAYLYTDKVIIEKALTNFREFNCAIFQDHNELITSCIEEVTHTKDILSFVDKYEKELNKLSDASNRDIPARIPTSLEEEITLFTKQVYQIFSLKGIIRVDYLYDNLTNKLYINEINNIPGSLAFYLFEPLNLNFTTLLNKVIHQALIDYNHKSQKITCFKSNILTKKSSKLMNK